MSDSFVHLHCHSSYSLLDGLGRINDLLAAAREHDMPALALTDHGTMFGSIEFYSAAQEAGVKPIVGCEVYVSDRPLDERPTPGARNYHLVLLAENERGYRNLIRLTTEAHLRGFYRKPRVDHALLEQHSDGLVCLSGCASGELATIILDGDLEAAERKADWHRQVFKDRYYLELQDHSLDFQGRINDGVLEVARRLNLPLVATNDVHYVQARHAETHEILLCIQTQTTMDDPKRMRLGTPEFYLKSTEQMHALFGHYPESLTNSLAIAERCNLDLTFGRPQLPRFQTPAGETSETYLRRLCEEGLRSRYGEATEEIRQRLDYELSIINKTGFVDYFLLVHDVIHFARRSGIGVGPGRGSAAGSLVAYALFITSIDPIAYGLSFERFLNPERVTMPDMDLDFADDRRDEVIRYVRQKYGDDRVAQIITFGTIGPRAGVRDVGRVLGMQYGDVDRVAKLIPPMCGSISKAKADVPELQQLASDPAMQQLLQTVEDLEGVARHASTHAAGVVIARDPLAEHVPLYKVPKSDQITTQYAMGTVEKIGLLKMDFLGLRTLTIIQRACALIKAGRGIDLDPESIDLEDPSIYQLLSTGETFGVFQVDGPGMRRLLREFQPERFEHVVALNALYRPGPMDHIPAFVDRRHGREQVSYDHPALEEVLRETHGIVVYQEQVMRLFSQVAGYSMGEADLVRRAMGKKKASELAKHKEVFLTRAEERGTSRDVAQHLWDIVEPFAGYAFNKCCHAQTRVTLPDGSRMTLAEAYRERPSELMAMWPDGQIRPHRVHRIVRTGRKPLLKVTVESGRCIKVTAEHRLLTTKGYLPAGSMTVGMELLTTPPVSEKMRRARRENIARVNSARGRASRPTYADVSVSRAAAALLDDVDRHLRQGSAGQPASLSSAEEQMAAWLRAQGINFDVHRRLPGGVVAPFYFHGLYWEMDQYDRSPEYFARKYGDLPHIVVTPEDYKYVVEHQLGLAHAENGEKIVSIEPCGEAMTYDVEMEPEGPLNFIANGIVSHNSHSAAYSMVTCITAYLKACFPREYLAGLLSAERENADKVAEAMRECRRLGIAILPPDINSSDVDFTLEGDAIRFGLSAVKNAGTGAVESILSVRREGGPFRNLEDLCSRLDWTVVNKRVIESLVRCGAVDSLGVERNRLVESLDRIVQFGTQMQRAAQAGQASLFGESDAPAAVLHLAPADPVSLEDRVAWETELLGISVSRHPVVDAEAQFREVGGVPVGDVQSIRDARRMRVGGLVRGVRSFNTKDGRPMANFTLTDLDSTVDVVVFSRSYEACRDLLADGAIVLVDGKLETQDGRVRLLADTLLTLDAAAGKPAPKDNGSNGNGRKPQPEPVPSGPPRRICIRISRTDDRGADVERIVAVYTVLQEFRGHDEVEMLVVQDGLQAPVPLPNRTTGFCPALEARLRALLPESAVSVTSPASI